MQLRHRNIHRTEYFFNDILWSDESTLHNIGFVNQHIYHYYSEENPQILIQVDYQHRLPVNDWGGILGEYIIGPYFLAGLSYTMMCCVFQKIFVVKLVMECGYNMMTLLLTVREII